MGLKFKAIDFLNAEFQRAQSVLKAYKGDGCPITELFYILRESLIQKLGIPKAAILLWYKAHLYVVAMTNPEALPCPHPTNASKLFPTDFTIVS